MKTYSDPFYYYSTPNLVAVYQFYRKAPRANRHARTLALIALLKLRAMHTVTVIN